MEELTYDAFRSDLLQFIENGKYKDFFKYIDDYVLDEDTENEMILKKAAYKRNETAYIEEGTMLKEEYNVELTSFGKALLAIFRDKKEKGGFFPLIKKTAETQTDNYLPEIRRALLSLNYNLELEIFEAFNNFNTPPAAFILDGFTDGHEIGFLRLMDFLVNRGSRQKLNLIYTEHFILKDDDQWDSTLAIQSWERDKTVIVVCKYEWLRADDHARIARRWKEMVDKSAAKSSSNRFFFIVLVRELVGEKPDFMLTVSEEDTEKPDTVVEKIRQSPVSMVYFKLPPQFSPEKHLSPWLSAWKNTPLKDRYGLPHLSYFATSSSPKETAYLFCEFMRERSQYEKCTYDDLIEAEFKNWKKKNPTK